MSFRSLTHYFLYLTQSDSEPEPQAPEKGGWERNMERAGDERRLQRIGERLQDLDLDNELLTDAGHRRLEAVKLLLHQARVACWKR